jgi:hypothetical protein
MYSNPDRVIACPPGFFLPVRVLSRRFRHIGFLANSHRSEKLALCRKLLAVVRPEPVPPRRWQDRLRELTGEDIDACPCCGGRMLTCGEILPQPPPRPPMWCDSS